MIAFHRPFADALHPGAFAAKPRVLLVEDQPMLRWYACDALTDAGYDVTEAADAAEAFRALVLEPFDVLVTDIDLGAGPDGLELARYARMAQPGLPVVYATGRAHVDPAECAPGSRLLAKPYSPRSLEHAASEAIDGGAPSGPKQLA